MKTLAGKLDMTLCVYQPVTDWIWRVRAKYGDTVAVACKNIIGVGWEQKMVVDLDKTPAEILDLAKSL